MTDKDKFYARVIENVFISNFTDEEQEFVLTCLAKSMKKNSRGDHNAFNVDGSIDRYRKPNWHADLNYSLKLS